MEFFPSCSTVCKRTAEMEVNSECLGMGGWPHFGDAGSGQVSSVAGPALDSVAASVQLPGASLGIPAALLLQ